VRNTGDPGGPVHIYSHIALVRWKRLTRMKTHANADHSGLERLLTAQCSSNGAPGRGERDEERVSLRIHLHPVMPIDHLAQR